MLSQCSDSIFIGFFLTLDMLHILLFLILLADYFTFQLLDLYLQLLDFFCTIWWAYQGYLPNLCRLYFELFGNIWNPLQNIFEANFWTLNLLFFAVEVALDHSFSVLCSPCVDIARWCCWKGRICWLNISLNLSLALREIVLLQNIDDLLLNLWLF